LIVVAPESAGSRRFPTKGEIMPPITESQAAPVWSPSAEPNRVARRRRRLIVAAAGLLAVAVGGAALPAQAQSLPAGDPPPTPSSPDTVQTFDDQLAAVARQVPEFAGVYVDDDSRTHLALTDTTDISRDRAATALGEVFEASSGALTEALAGGEVVVERADFGFTALKDWYDRSSSGVLALDGVVFTDIDERVNRVAVGVARPEAIRSVRAELARLGVPAEAAVVTVVPAATLASLQNAITPKVGGVQITNSGGGTCTLGFNARRAGVSGFVTNSHCTDVQGGVENTQFWQPKVLGPCVGLCMPTATETVDPAYFAGLGVCPAGRVCRFSDAAFAAYSFDSPKFSTRGRIARPAADYTISWNGVSTYRVIGEWDPFVGLSATKVGKSSGRSPGEVLTTCASVNLSLNGVDTGITLLCQDRASVAVLQGDSGSAVFHVSGTDALLLGVLWGLSGWFSPINLVEAELGALNTCPSGFSC
jgi:hypothetical protein